MRDEEYLLDLHRQKIELHQAFAELMGAPERYEYIIMCEIQTEEERLRRMKIMFEMVEKGMSIPGEPHDLSQPWPPPSKTGQPFNPHLN